MDSPWNRAVGFPAALMRHADRMAAQHRRAVQLPSGKVVEFNSPTGDPQPLAEYLRRQVLPVGDSRDPRVVGA